MTSNSCLNKTAKSDKEQWTNNKCILKFTTGQSNQWLWRYEKKIGVKITPRFPKWTTGKTEYPLTETGNTVGESDLGWWWWWYQELSFRHAKYEMTVKSKAEMSMRSLDIMCMENRPETMNGDIYLGIII